MKGSHPAFAPSLAAISDGALEGVRSDVLWDRERQHLLSVLYQLDSRDTLSAIARTVAVSMDAIEPGEADRIHIRLYHVHVPKLERVGLVDFDEADRTVELTDRGEAVAETFAKRHRLAPA